MSIRLKIILSVVITEALLLLILVGGLYQYTKHSNAEALDDYIATTKRLLVTTTQDAIISYDLATLESYLEVALRNEKIAYIRILDSSNNTLAEAGTKQLKDSFRIDTDYGSVDDGLFDDKISVDIDKVNYGSIEIGFNIQPFEASLKRILQLAGFIVSVELILVLVFSFFIGSILTKQLKILRNAARNIAKGDYTQSITVKGHDEVADVAHAFSAMVNNLRHSEEMAQSYQEELLEFNKDLEARVKSRTQEITAQKNKLEEAYENLTVTKEQLIKSEKMASIGQLAAGVAHEINNPIAFIKSNLHSLKKYISLYKELFAHHSDIITAIKADDQKMAEEKIHTIHTIEQEEDLAFINEDIIELLNESIGGTARVQEIVKGLKTYSHSANDELEPTDLNQCLDDTLKMLNNEIKHQCDVVTHLKPIPLLVCNSGQMIQVFTNLIANAGQAMEEHGTLKISSELSQNSRGNIIEITIEDNGKGIAPEHLPKLFDPFFTTKPVGQGTGLGLSISQGIIEDHLGTMTVESMVGVGTTFTIQLPVNRE